MTAVHPDDDAPEPGPAMAGLVLGVVAIVLSPLLVGCLAGAIGLGLSVGPLVRRRPGRALAVWGAALSTLGIVASLAAGAFYYRRVARPIASAIERGSSVVAAPDRPPARSGSLVLTTIDGKKVDLGATGGKALLVDFWATWCKPCVEEIPHLGALARRHDADLVVVAITDEDPDEVATFARTHPMPYHVVAGVDDDTLPRPYRGVRSLPTAFFIDGSGAVRSVMSGFAGKDGLDARAEMLVAARRKAQGETDEALRRAALALETHYGGATADDLAAPFDGDPRFAEIREGVQRRLEGLLGHYEVSHDKGDLGRDRTTLLWAIWSLGAEKKDRASVPYLIPYLRESAIDEARWRAADALWLIGDPAAVPDLVKALHDPEPMVAGFAASALGDLGDRAAAGPVLDLFQRLPDNRAEAKARAADALGKIGDARAIAPLSASLRVIRDPAYVRWAQPALSRLEQRSKPRAVTGAPRTE
jgi:thiol-disulfide isomerase/thioredoxin